MPHETTIDILNDLLTNARDGQQGYAKAAEEAKARPNLVAFFRRQCKLRRHLAHELSETITRLGGTPEEGSSVAAKAHRIWMVVKDFVIHDDEDAVLEECRRGEEAAIREYNEALENQDLPPQIAKLLRNQRSQIAEALSFIRSMSALPRVHLGGKFSPRCRASRRASNS